MPVAPAGGGGGASWNGTISVVPGELEASAPGFEGAGDQAALAMASTMAWGDPGGTGITDGKAAGAWSQLVKVWTQELSNLQQDFYSVGGAIVVGAIDYHATDVAVMPACPAPQP